MTNAGIAESVDKVSNFVTGPTGQAKSCRLSKGGERRIPGHRPSPTSGWSREEGGLEALSASYTTAIPAGTNWNVPPTPLPLPLPQSQAAGCRVVGLSRHGRLSRDDDDDDEEEGRDGVLSAVVVENPVRMS